MLNHTSLKLYMCACAHACVYIKKPEFNMIRKVWFIVKAQSLRQRRAQWEFSEPSLHWFPCMADSLSWVTQKYLPISVFVIILGQGWEILSRDPYLSGSGMDIPDAHGYESSGCPEGPLSTQSLTDISAHFCICSAQSAWPCSINTSLV